MPKVPKVMVRLRRINTIEYCRLKIEYLRYPFDFK